MTKEVLLIKLSSMGDVIHTFPAITDAYKTLGVNFTWVIDDSLKELASMHPAVKNIIPVKLRSWKKNIFRKSSWQEAKAAIKELRANKYDLAIDCQGLLKSAIIANIAKTKSKAGFARGVARESAATYLYNKSITVETNNHVISKIRQLFTKSLGYQQPEQLDYGINVESKNINGEPYIFLAHGTTWKSKHWLDEHWFELCKLIVNSGYKVKITAANNEEETRAKKIQKISDKVIVLPKSNLITVAQEIKSAKAVVAVDTGFGHMAAALNTKTIMLFGPTAPSLVGVKIAGQIDMQAKKDCIPCKAKQCRLITKDEPLVPCMQLLTPELVWAKLQTFFK